MLTLFFSIAGGVAASILIPIMVEGFSKDHKPVPGGDSKAARLWTITRPYLVIAILSLVASFVLLAFMYDQVTDWRAAVLIGFSFDSFLQHLRSRKPATA